MRRTPKKKKTVKKKAATKSRPKPKVDDSAEFEAWAEKQKQRAGCDTICAAGVADTVRALLQALIRKRVYKFTIHEIQRKIEEKHPDVHVGQRGLERHLRVCERALYFRARGRRNV